MLEGIGEVKGAGAEHERKATREELDAARMERMIKERPGVGAAVQELRQRAPKLKGNGIFRHPSEFDENEINFIVDCLKANVPEYMIANMVHCERHLIRKLIERTPELKELKEQKYENILDSAEYQADQLIKQGNSAMIIFTLQTLGRKRGWSTDDVGAGGGEDEDRVVMGLIPEEEVSAAEAARAELAASDEAEAAKRKAAREGEPDPLQMALTEEAVQSEVERRVEERRPESIEADAVSEPPYGGGGYGDGAVEAPADADPWASGADSMFYQ